MSVIELQSMLPLVGRARARQSGRAWFLMADAISGRQRLTDDPGPGSREMLLAVYSPVQDDDEPA